MNVFLITFDLRNEQKDYEPFFVTMRGYAFQWWHFMRFAVIVTTALSLDELSEKLSAHLESPPDSLLIVPMGPDANGLLPKEAWEWINQVTGSTRTPCEPQPLSLLQQILLEGKSEQK